MRWFACCVMFLPGGGRGALQCSEGEEEEKMRRVAKAVEVSQL